jgi:hypothetical protein
MTSPYAAFSGHPLANVPQSTLDIARAVLAGAAREHDVDPEMVVPIADSVVARLAEAGLLRDADDSETSGSVAQIQTERR